MRTIIYTVLVLLLTTSCQKEYPQLLIKTELGDIKVEVYEKKAPITVKNFLRLVDEGVYKESHFYRVVRMDNQPEDPGIATIAKGVHIEVIQGGVSRKKGEIERSTISHETTKQTGVRHLNGTISMARGKVGTASSEFFICVNNQPELDYGGKRNPDGQGFAAFGSVIQGMDVVKQIQHQPDSGQQLLAPVLIYNIELVK